jgi:hypothetical protein
MAVNEQIQTNRQERRRSAPQGFQLKVPIEELRKTDKEACY